MSMNMNEEESEVMEGFTRIIRAASMSAMQVKEAADRRRQEQEKMSESERAQAAQREQERTAVDRRVADSVYKSMQSPVFWNHADNQRIAERMTVAQQLATDHSKADSAFMMGSDVLRDKYGIDAVAIMHGPGTPMERQSQLLEALDHHNAAGRLREEANHSERNAERASDESQPDARTEVEDAKYSQRTLDAVAGEAAEAGFTSEAYLDALPENQHENILYEHDRGIEDSQDRDDRIQLVQETATENDSAPETEPAESHHAHADAADERAHAETEAEHASLSRAAQTGDVQSQREAQLATVGAHDRQAAGARRQSLKNVPGSARSYKVQSMQSTATPRKAAAAGQKTGREHVQER